MDTSIEYIKMCDISEIQEVMPYSSWKYGDYIVHTLDEGYRLGRLFKLEVTMQDDIEVIDKISLGTCEESLFDTEMDYPIIKVFSQEDIQKLFLMIHGWSIFKLLVEFNYYYYNVISSREDKKFFNSLEKCWLSFYMALIHNQEYVVGEWKMLQVEKI